MKNKQKDIIIKYLKKIYPKWEMSYNIIKVNTAFGWLGTSADRLARKLSEEGVLNREREGRYTKYQYKK